MNYYKHKLFLNTNSTYDPLDKNKGRYIPNDLKYKYSSKKSNNIIEDDDNEEISLNYHKKKKNDRFKRFISKKKRKKNVNKKLKTNNNVSVSSSSLSLIDTNKNEDKIRDKTYNLILDILTINTQDGICDIAEDIEEAVYALYDGINDEYRSKIRLLCSNLKLNSELRMKVINRKIRPAQLCLMNIEELAPFELKKERENIKKERLNKLIQEKPSGIVTNEYKCEKCYSNNCVYWILSNRQIDVAKAETWGTSSTKDSDVMLNIECLNCGKEWQRKQ